MTYSIREVSIEGVRGVNKRLSLPLHDAVNLFFGPNGVGKSSILQSIEWCLTGKISYLTGPDFTREDAIVNPWHPRKRAEVSVTLKDESGKTIVATRTRKMAKSTTRGASDLTISINGKVLGGDEAQNELNKIIGVKPDDFSKVVYLHQESIRDLATLDPTERSRTIDKLLGTIEVRELTEALEARRAIGTATKRLSSRIEVLQRDKVQFVVRMRERLNKEKEALQAKGYSEPELSAENLMNLTKNIVEELEVIAKRLGATKPEIKPVELTLTSIDETIAESERNLTTLDRFRSAAYRAQEERRLNLENLKMRYNQAVKDLEEFGAITPDSVLAEKADVEGQIKQLTSLLENSQKSFTDLTAVKMNFEYAKHQIKGCEGRLKEIEGRYGDRNQHLELIKQLELKLEQLRDEIHRFATYDQMIALSQQYISEAKPSECPVCSQPIDYNAVLVKLQKEIKAQISEKLEQLRIEEKGVKERTSDIERSLEEYKSVKLELTTQRERLESTIHQIENIVQVKVNANFNIDQRIGDIKEQMSQFQTQLTSLSRKLTELSQKYTILTARLNTLQEAQVRIQQATKSGLTGKDLLKLLEDEIQNARNRAKSYENTTQLDVVAGRISKVKEVYQYLKDKEEVEQVERELPQITKFIEDLKTRIERLSLLEGSLDALRQVALEFEKETVMNTLESLRSTINQFYGAMGGHPYFGSLELEIEKEEPLIYSIKGIGVDPVLSTRIPTRFSTTQMNVTALSLLLSNNVKIAKDFDVILMDDPTQSMDKEHKEALAKVIHSLSQSKQVIVATQDPELRDALIDTCKEKLYTYEIKGWTVDGPVMATNK